MRMLPYCTALLLAAASMAGAQLPALAAPPIPAARLAHPGPLTPYAPAAPAVVAWADAGHMDLPPMRSGFAAEPADSLYRLARAALNDGDFRKAATLFQTVVDRYPDSEFAVDALYWKAYALFRGAAGSRDLQLAMDALDRQETRYPKAPTLGDAKQLRASIRSEQARRGDAGAFTMMQQDVTRLNQEKGCPTADDDARFSALRGLQQIAPDEVLPVLQKLLARTDECSVKLRLSSVMMVAQTKEEERSDILLRVASTDPNASVRREAVQYLAEVNTERAARALDSILFGSKDAEMRDRALSALSRHRSATARASMRKFVEQTNVPTDLRVRAVMNIATSSRRTGDESEFLFALFNKTASPELREAIIEGIYQIGKQSGTSTTTFGPAQQQGSRMSEKSLSWMLGVARDKRQEIEVRKKALYYASQGGVEQKDLFNLYDEMSGQQEMQEQMLYVYRQRKEPEATDKLMQIAKNEKNVELRKKAIAYLGDRKDPRVRQFLLDIVNP